MARTFLIIVFCFATSVIVSCSSFSANNKDNLIVILVKVENGKETYEISSEQISIVRLKTKLREHLEAGGDSCQVIVLAHRNVSFSNLNNLRGLVWKVGLKNIRYFYYNEDTQMMLELFFSNKAIPFSKESFNHSQ
jgi:biopolymer transport protein ExbD